MSELAQVQEPSRRRIALEIVAILAVAYVPDLLRSLDGYLSHLPPDYTNHALSALLPISLRLGEIFIVLYVAWRSGKGLAAFGLLKPRVVDLVYGLLVFGVLELAMVRATDSSTFWTSFQGRGQWQLPSAGSDLRA